MKKLLAVIISVSLLLLFSGCAQKGEQKGPYLAKVGNSTITQADFEREMKNLPPFAQNLFVGPEGKEKFLQELVKKELLYQEALKKGLDKDPEYSKKLEDYKKITLITQLLEKELESKAKVTEQDAREYYEKHKNELASVSQIKASHILVKTEDEAKKILEKLRKGGDFATIAKQSSIDPGSAKNGGDLGYFSSGQMVPEFEAAALKLNPGEISEPVKTKFGYHIIKVTDKKMGKPLEYEKIKNALMQRITAEKQRDVFDSYIESLKKNYKVEINKDALAKLETSPAKKEDSVEKLLKQQEQKQDKKDTRKKD